MTYLLRFTNPQDGSRHYFCNFGNLWPGHPERRLIERTSPAQSDAHRYATEDEANTALVIAGQPSHWEILPLT